MTREENLKKIKDACVKANPEIMELKFGCKVRNFLKGTAIILRVHKYAGETDCYDVAYYLLPELIVERSPFNNWDILGRDITLSDVLVAIGQIARDTSYSIDLMGSFWRYEDGSTEWETFTDAEWRLLKPLHEQTDETLEFIANLLQTN